MIHKNKNSIVFFLTLGLLTVNLAGQEPTAEKLPTATEVIDKYVMLLGGYEVLESVQSCHCQMSVISVEERGLTLQYEAFRKSGQYHESYDGSDGRRLDRGAKDGIGWERTNGIVRRYSGKELNNSLRNCQHVSAPPNWLATSKKIECKSIETIDDRFAYLLHFVNDDDSTIDRYFDVETGMLIKSVADTEYGGKPQKVVCEYLEHKKIGEQMVVTKQRIAFGSRTYVYVVDFCDFDVKIPESTFDIPDSIQEQIGQKQKAPFPIKVRKLK